MYKLVYILLLCLFGACATLPHSGRTNAAKVQRMVAESEVFGKAFSGFCLVDAASGKQLVHFNENKYFTPASNTKILTLYTCLQVLGDSIAALEYAENATGDTVFVRGTSDPAFLNPNFNAWQTAFSWFKSRKDKQMVHAGGKWAERRYGPGWSWDDLPYDYAPERLEFPIYGGLMRIENGSDPEKRRVYPAYLQHQLFPRDLQERYPLHRFNYNPEDHGGFSNFWPETQDSIYDQPIVFLQLSPWELLEDSLGENINIPESFVSRALDWKKLYATPLDTVLKRMMYESDNFVAEHLLLHSAGEKLGLLRQDSMIRWVLDSSLRHLPQALRWEDGSGLSRYNLFTPQSLCYVLSALWKTQEPERLLQLFPAGGIHGTLANWYAGKTGQPYVFAKTGSMSGVYCLSGYLRARSGKMLIFSFMHNNFKGSNRKWKEETQRVLEYIYEKY